MKYNFSETVEALKTADRPCQVLSEFKGLIGKFGYDHFLVTGLPLPGRGETILSHTVLNSWPEEWYDRYIAKNYLDVDPIAAEVFKRIDSFKWSDIGVDESDLKAQAVMSDARNAKMSDGLVIPIDTRTAAVGCVTMAGDKPEVSVEEQNNLHLAAIFAHGRTKQLMLEQNGIVQSIPQLHPREIECLKWVAVGKTTWDIGEILGLSQHTIKGYLRNTKTKLNAINHAQAVSEGYRIGILG